MKNYMLGIYLQTNLQEDALPQVGKGYRGVLTVTGENDAKFAEQTKCKTDGTRNVPIYAGKHINSTIRPDDAHVRLNFKEIHFGPDFNVDAFAIEVMNEIREALDEAKCFVGKDVTAE